MLSITALEVPDPVVAVFGKLKIIYAPEPSMEHTTKLIEFDIWVFPPSAVAVKVMGYDPVVTVESVADLQAVEVSVEQLG